MSRIELDGSSAIPSEYEATIGKRDWRTSKVPLWVPRYQSPLVCKQLPPHLVMIKLFVMQRVRYGCMQERTRYGRQ
jgi:hypothetical protein